MNSKVFNKVNNYFQQSLKESNCMDEDSFSYAAAKAKVAGKNKFSFGGKEHPVKMSLEKAKKIVNENECSLKESNAIKNFALLVSEVYDDLNEKKKRKPGQPEYYKGTRKSNKSMEREINKCAKNPRPKSCYDYWDADKKYDKSKKNEADGEKIMLSTMPDVHIEFSSEDILNEKKKTKKSKKLSAKTRETLKKKAKNANMPLGALTSVYRKGLAAWLTGHRQGVPQHAWAMARVNSFISGGKTRSVDKAEWKKVQNFRKKK